MFEMYKLSFRKMNVTQLTIEIQVNVKCDMMENILVKRFGDHSFHTSD